MTSRFEVQDSKPTPVVCAIEQNDISYQNLLVTYLKKGGSQITDCELKATNERKQTKYFKTKSFVIILVTND